LKIQVGLKKYNIKMEKTFNILLTTIGRDSLTRMVNSIYPQLKKDDYLTIICDCKLSDVLPKITECLEHAVCNINLVQNSEVKGFFGHNSRNFYQNNLFGDYILNADDDNYYVPNAMEMVRQSCTENKLYIFKCFGSGRTFPDAYVVEYGNIDTACGVIPNNRNLPIWEERYGGDADFYTSLIQQIEYEFVDNIIYRFRDF
jgi:hypothetical protein